MSMTTVLQIRIETTSLLTHIAEGKVGRISVNLIINHHFWRNNCSNSDQIITRCFKIRKI
ncbi:hypothetical protein D9M68_554240 [compost metagenome]